jgi:hypothetical protein
MQYGGLMFPLGNGQQFMDGHKYLCGVEALKAPCTILSLGRCACDGAATLSNTHIVANVNKDRRTHTLTTSPLHFMLLGHAWPTCSNGDTSFEQEMMKNTPCDLVTVDCTLANGLQLLGPRHKYGDVLVSFVWEGRGGGGARGLQICVSV